MDDPAGSEMLATRGGNALLLLFSWLWVGIPLVWGVLETLRTSLALWR
jgi:hypothetical protein